MEIEDGPADTRSAQEAGRRVVEKERERKAFLEKKFPGALGELLAGGGILLLFAVIVGPWVAFWIGPMPPHVKVSLTPHLGPIPQVSWVTPKWIFAIALPYALIPLTFMFRIVFRGKSWPPGSVLAGGYNAAAFAVMFASMIGIFATAYLQASHSYTASFGHRLNHVKALYFTITTFTTTGFGDIAPQSDGCRLMVAFQTLVALLVIALAIAALAARLIRQFSRVP